jgi:general secretion pathway protein H
MVGSSKASVQRGFSLIEMLVVLAIIGIVTAAAGLAAVSGQASRQLRDDAARLSQLFALAQAHAQAWGTAVAWRHNASRYWFEPVFLPRPALVSSLRVHSSQQEAGMFDSGVLRPRRWSSDSAVHVSVAPAGNVVFLADWLSGPHRVELSDGQNTIVIDRQAMGVYRVQP